MRSILIMAMFTASLADAAASDYEEVRDLRLGTGGIDSLSVEAGAGRMEIVGVEGGAEIAVTATIIVPGRDADKARRKMESGMVLSLEKIGATAVLKSWFEEGFWGFRDSPAIHLQVDMPQSLALAVNDGSGAVDVRNVRGDIAIDDGSGEIRMAGVGGNVRLDDGSGAIDIDDVGGDLYINDGSGAIRVRRVAGSVTIDDGSGGIDVSDVEQDLLIVNDGSGGFNFSNIAGRVENNN